ncbi:MAG: hemin uptake protein HemP [Chromatiaceae bacterium]|nr:MAG: hemin uptake protein HemP [Chromatiaceae bacterium]
MTPPIINPAHEPKTMGAGAPPPRRMRSTELLQGARRVVIEHGDASYTLLLTRNDKLILVK